MGVTSSLFFVALSSSNSDPEMGEGSLSEIASYAEITTDSVGDDDETSFDPEEFHPSYKRAVVSKSDFSLQFDVTQSNSWAESLETCKQSGRWGNPEWGKDESKSLHFRGVIPCCNSFDD